MSQSRLFHLKILTTLLLLLYFGTIWIFFGFLIRSGETSISYETHLTNKTFMEQTYGHAEIIIEIS